MPESRGCVPGWSEPKYECRERDESVSKGRLSESHHGWQLIALGNVIYKISTF